MEKLVSRRALINFCLTLGGDVVEDYPFHDPDWTVMRHWGNKKGFAFIYTHGEALQVNVKCEPGMIAFWQNAFPGVIPGYHMNKTHWNTILLDGSVPDREIMTMLADSYRLTAPPMKTQNRKSEREGSQ